MNYESIPKYETAEAPELIKMQYSMVVSTHRKPLFRFFKRNLLSKTFLFKPCVATNMPRIAAAILSLPKELHGNSIEDMAIDKIEAHLPTLVYIVAAAIQNNNKEPSRGLLGVIEENFDHEDLVLGFNYAVTQLRLDKFVHAVVLIRGTSSVLKPAEEERELL